MDDNILLKRLNESITERNILLQLLRDIYPNCDSDIQQKILLEIRLDILMWETEFDKDYMQWMDSEMIDSYINYD